MPSFARTTRSPVAAFLLLAVLLALLSGCHGSGRGGSSQVARAEGAEAPSSEPGTHRPVEALDASCDLGDVNACATLGKLYAEGSPVLRMNRDLEASADYFAYACQHDDSSSCHALASMSRGAQASAPTVPAPQPERVRNWPSWSSERPPRPSAPTRAAELPATALYKRAAPSVYWVNVLGSTEMMMQGSAVAVTPHHLLTNCHLFKAPGLIFVGQQGEFGAVTLQAADPATDRCWLYSGLLQFNPVAGVRAFDGLEVGETVYSIGAPQGLEATLAPGIISGKRDLRIVQTTAPMSPGSSGGALFDARGNLVAITTATRADSQAINFCVSAASFWE